jgi:hypothetical protein
MIIFSSRRSHAIGGDGREKGAAEPPGEQAPEAEAGPGCCGGHRLSTAWPWNESWNGRPGNFSAMGASGAICRVICAGHAISAREHASRNASLTMFRATATFSFQSSTGTSRHRQSSLGYEPYDACLGRLARSPMAALTSADGCGSFVTACGVSRLLTFITGMRFARFWGCELRLCWPRLADLRTKPRPVVSCPNGAGARSSGA